MNVPVDLDYNDFMFILDNRIREKYALRLYESPSPLNKHTPRLKVMIRFFYKLPSLVGPSFI